MTPKTFAAAFLTATFLTVCASTPDNPFDDPVGERMVELADDYRKAEKAYGKAESDLKDAQKAERRAKRDLEDAQDHLGKAQRALQLARSARDADRLLMEETEGLSPDPERTEELMKNVRKARKQVEAEREDIAKARRDIDRAKDRQRKARTRMDAAKDDMDAATEAYKKGR